MPNITNYVVDLLRETAARDSELLFASTVIQEPSGLERLPTEIFDEISSQLPTRSALALHQTSSTLSRKVPLDNSFWRKSIKNRRALSYIWDLDINDLEKRSQEHSAASQNLNDIWDWRDIGQLLETNVFSLKTSDSRIENLPNGLWNRRRIWSIVGEACTHHFSKNSTGDGSNSVIADRKHREPVFSWQLEEIMDDLGHYS